jgi:hypothetical protein
MRNNRARDLKGAVASEADDTKVEDVTVSNDEQRAARLAASRRGGLKGGPSRAAKLSPERRAEIARRAAEARWAKRSRNRKRD